MDVHDFHSWVQQRERQRHEHIPAADKVVPLVAQAGGRGMSRGEIGKAVGDALDRDSLSALLDALVRSGMLTVSRQGGFEVFRSRAGGGASWRSQQGSM